MTLFLNDRDKRFEEDFVSSIILAALTDDGRFEIRNNAEFEERAEIARGEMAAIADKRSTLLEQMVELYDKIKSTLRKAENIAVQECEDAENQLTFLFKPGFLCRDIVWVRYPRYLRALNIRAERINSAPLKDQEKMQPVIPFAERFELALQTVNDFEKSFDLYEFWLMLEEFRIAQFAPEVRPLEKVSAQKLQKVWDEVRL
jgi:ATP-dependent helicase HrpA